MVRQPCVCVSVKCIMTIPDKATTPHYGITMSVSDAMTTTDDATTNTGEITTTLSVCVTSYHYS